MLSKEIKKIPYQKKLKLFQEDWFVTSLTADLWSVIRQMGESQNGFYKKT